MAKHKSADLTYFNLQYIYRINCYWFVNVIDRSYFWAKTESFASVVFFFMLSDNPTSFSTSWSSLISNIVLTAGGWSSLSEAAISGVYFKSWESLAGVTGGIWRRALPARHCPLFVIRSFSFVWPFFHWARGARRGDNPKREGGSSRSSHSPFPL